MKPDFPVSNPEILMQKSQILVMKTDLSGKITYGNDTFLELTGITRHELMGAAHSIIRHPDIPTEVYIDIGESLSALKPWTGILKGKTKKGSFFWFESNAIPLFKNGKVCDHLLVRYKPTPEQIEIAKTLYLKINQKKATLMPVGFSLLFKAIREITIWKKMALATSLFLLPLVLFMYKLFVVHDFVVWGGVFSLAAFATALIASLTLLVRNSLENSAFILYSMANGQFRNKIDLNRNDQLGDFFRGIYSTQVKMNSHMRTIHKKR
ncbi:MAG: PAS domain S-box protein [Methylococcaceae bacterium]|nr:PAS domain S-box protein [Methylococcaceae bacterium]